MRSIRRSHYIHSLFPDSLCGSDGCLNLAQARFAGVQRIGRTGCKADIGAGVSAAGQVEHVARTRRASLPGDDRGRRAGDEEEAVRDLRRRTVFSSQCPLIAGSLKRRVYSFMLSGQREPRDGH
jgi:hypothetical protein